MSAFAMLDRRDVVRQLLRNRGELLVVSGLGSSTYDVFAAGDHAQNVYLWGAMGSAAMIGFGLAKAQPDKAVLVVTGDGEILMGMGSLATIGIVQPPNLTVVVLDNGHYGETGMQLSHAGSGVELNQVASACGFNRSEVIVDVDGIEKLRSWLSPVGGLGFATIKVSSDETPRKLPSRDGVYIKHRFRGSLGFGA